MWTVDYSSTSLMTNVTTSTTEALTFSACDSFLMKPLLVPSSRPNRLSRLLMTKWTIEFRVRLSYLKKSLIRTRVLRRARRYGRCVQVRVMDCGVEPFEVGTREHGVKTCTGRRIS